MGNDDLYFNGHNFKDLLKVEKVEMSLLPPLENVLQRVPGRAGSLFRKNQLGSREIIIYCRLIKRSKDEIFETRRTLAKLLYTESPKQLKFKNEKGLYYNAILDGDIKFTTSGKSAEIILKFIAHDPLGYSEEKRISTRRGLVQFNYNGSYKTKPIIQITFTGQVDSFRISDNTSYDFISIKNTFYPNTVLKIDCIENYISINGSKSMHLLNYESTFFEIKTPLVQWTLSSNNVECDIFYQERWL